MAATEITKLLVELKDGDRAAVAAKLMPLVYDEFRALAAQYLKRERADHTLQPTALVHEAYLRLIDQTRVDWQGRTHFFAVGAQAIRRILVDHARQRKRQNSLYQRPWPRRSTTQERQRSIRNDFYQEVYAAMGQKLANENSERPAPP